MSYLKTLPFLGIGMLMIVSSREHTVKYGLMIVSACVLYLWIKSKLASWTKAGE